MLFTFRSEKVCDSVHVYVCTIVIYKRVCRAITGTCILVRKLKQVKKHCNHKQMNRKLM